MTEQASYTIGKLKITRLTEQMFSVPQGKLFPTSGDESPAEQADMPVNMSVHSWLVETPNRIMLIDTATGNGKDRPFSPLLHQLNSPWMENLTAAGIDPADVDYVLHTHLHTDHVGWNTVPNGDSWIPTFPNATWVCPQAEVTFMTSPAAAARRVVFDDSVQPIIDARRLVTLPDEITEYLPGIVFYPTPGHSPGHMSIAFVTEGETAIFLGDVMHSAIQVAHPQWNSMFCGKGPLAAESRRWLLDFAATENATVFTSHFDRTSAGRITKDNDRFIWTFV